MFGIGFPELVVILIVALLVVGPKKLPEVARSVGRALGEFRRMADDVKESLEQEIDRDEQDARPGEVPAGKAPAARAPASEIPGGRDKVLGDGAGSPSQDAPAPAAPADAATPDPYGQKGA